MSRDIDLNRELTEDEVKYLEDRGWQHKLDENALNLMGGGVSEDEIEEVVIEETTITETKTVEPLPPVPAPIAPAPETVDEKTGDPDATAGVGDDESK